MIVDQNAERVYVTSKYIVKMHFLEAKPTKPVFDIDIRCVLMLNEFS